LAEGAVTSSLLNNQTTKEISFHGYKVEKKGGLSTFFSVLSNLNLTNELSF
jgi:hypothetical protein